MYINIATLEISDTQNRTILWNRLHTPPLNRTKQPRDANMRVALSRISASVLYWVESLSNQ